MLYLLRHGVTDYNQQKKLQGITDIPLNEEGRKQAKEAKEKYADFKFDICYSSPLSRAKETAQIILEGRDIPIIEDEGLKEISFGKYERTANAAKYTAHPTYRFFHDPANYHACCQAEPLDHLYQRTYDFLKETAVPALKEGKNVLVAGHCAMNLSIYNQIYRIPLERFWENAMGNGEIIGIEDAKVFDIFNDC